MRTIGSNIFISKEVSGRFPLLLVEKVDFQATEMALCAAFLQYNNKKGFALLNFGQICSVNHQNLVISRSKTVDIVVEISCKFHWRPCFHPNQDSEVVCPNFYKLRLS